MQAIRLVLPSLGCVVALVLVTAAGCNGKSAPPAAPNTNAQAVPKMKMTTEIPADILTPDTVETPIGTLKFADGLPDKDTVQKVYDNGPHAWCRRVSQHDVGSFHLGQYRRSA